MRALTTLYLSLNERFRLFTRGTRGGLAPVRGRPDWLRHLETYRATGFARAAVALSLHVNL